MNLPNIKLCDDCQSRGPEVERPVARQKDKYNGGMKSIYGTTPEPNRMIIFVSDFRLRSSVFRQIIQEFHYYKLGKKKKSSSKLPQSLSPQNLQKFASEACPSLPQLGQDWVLIFCSLMMCIFEVTIPVGTAIIP
jgi:hypothetical protein